jgi:hypothetical protein
MSKGTKRLFVTMVKVIDSVAAEEQIISRKRVADHGEVYTNIREATAMLDMVKQETERIESRFLEPACGTGKFLKEILERKLRVVGSRYGKSQLDYERNAILAVSSVYGIDILEDNVLECRRRLFQMLDHKYSRLFKKNAKQECRNAVQFILAKNIIWGDALTLTAVDETRRPIVFSEWSPVNGSMLKRRDFALPLLSTVNSSLCSDLGGEVFIPSPVRDYPLTHFMRVSDAEQQELQS